MGLKLSIKVLLCEIRTIPDNCRHYASASSSHGAYTPQTLWWVRISVMVNPTALHRPDADLLQRSGDGGRQHGSVTRRVGPRRVAPSIRDYR